MDNVNIFSHEEGYGLLICSIALSTNQYKTFSASSKRVPKHQLWAEKVFLFSLFPFHSLFLSSPNLPNHIEQEPLILCSKWRDLWKLRSMALWYWNPPSLKNSYQGYPSNPQSLTTEFWPNFTTLCCDFWTRFIRDCVCLCVSVCVCVCVCVSVSVSGIGVMAIKKDWCPLWQSASSIEGDRSV